ncbi:helix-turn-helix transcriptional regulator [Diplocloster hominis]|uniref:helix-turn-helix domain-containing protein n=1 Tax=Diplocloster hominis TaxID=3079010 RepID=UPI0031BAF6A5
MEVGLKIKKYLEENGISQVHVSKEANIDPVKLNLALNGKRRLTFQEYELLCGVLGVNTDFFLKPRLPSQQNKKIVNV